MSAASDSGATDGFEGKEEAVKMGDAINDFATEVRYRLHANIPTHGERMPLGLNTAPVLTLRATRAEYQSLNLKVRKPTKRRKAVLGKVQTDKLATARFDGATELEHIFGKNWFLSYDGRNLMVIMGPILIDFVQQRWTSRRWTRDSDMRPTPTVDLDEATFLDMKIHYSYTTVFWDQPDALKIALSMASPSRDDASEESEG